MIDEIKLYKVGRTLLLIQGVYFLISGIWPLLDMPSFLAVTGPKTDLWLVDTMGLMIVVVGTALALAGLRASVTLEMVVLAVGSAVVLTGIDMGYAAARVISPVYLLDAAAEIMLLIGWLVIGWFSLRKVRRMSEWNPDGRRRMPLMHPRQFGY